MTRRRQFALFGGILVLSVVSWLRLSRGPEDGAPSNKPPRSTGADLPSAGPTTLSGQIFGTTYKVRALLPEGVTEEEARSRVHGALLEVDSLMSTYSPQSELSRLNGAPDKTPIHVSPPLMTVLELSLSVHEQTEGAFDVTVGPLVSAWGFGAGAKSEPPTRDELEVLRQRVGSDHLLLDVNGRTLTKEVPGMALDLSAVAKGYGVDQAARALEKIGCRNYMVEVGGEIAVRGVKAPGRPWILGIELPDPDGRKLYGKLIIEHGALATSGDYRNFRELAGRLVSHTFDPRTGQPTPHRTASVSVVRPTAAEADALATALGVLTPERAIELANTHGWAVLLLVHAPGGFAEKTSEAFSRVTFDRVPVN